jgi:hypothetical protein
MSLTPHHRMQNGGSHFCQATYPIRSATSTDICTDTQYGRTFRLGVYLAFPRHEPGSAEHEARAALGALHIESCLHGMDCWRSELYDDMTLWDERSMMALDFSAV